MKKVLAALTGIVFLFGITGIMEVSAKSNERNPFQREIDTVKTYETKIKEENAKKEPDKDKIKKYEEAVEKIRSKVEKKIERKTERYRKQLEKIEDRISKLKERKRNASRYEKQQKDLQKEIEKWEGYAAALQGGKAKDKGGFDDIFEDGKGKGKDKGAKDEKKK